MISRTGRDRQPDLLVRTTNMLDPNRIPVQIRAEVVSLLKSLMAHHVAPVVAASREVIDE